MRTARRTAYRAILGIAGLSVGILQAIVSTNALRWSPWTVVSIASGVGMVNFLDSMRLLISDQRAAGRHAARTSMHPPLVTALYLISQKTDVDLIHFGASIFCLRRYWTFRRCGIPVPWLPWYEERLHRVLRFRISDRPQESNVKWTRGKGTIGECWEENVAKLHDRRPTAAQFGGANHPDDWTFSRLKHDQHCNFTRDEFVQMIDKYGEILAVPIVREHAGELIGVLSIDCSASAYPSATSPSVLGGVAVEEFAIRAATLVQSDLLKF